MIAKIKKSYFNFYLVFFFFFVFKSHFFFINKTLGHSIYCLKHRFLTKAKKKIVWLGLHVEKSKVGRSRFLFLTTTKKKGIRDKNLKKVGKFMVLNRDKKDGFSKEL